MAKLIKFKSIRKGNFTAIDLTTVEDRSLSWKAKGIHLYLMSRPPEWTVRATDLIRRSKDGRDSLYNGLKELVDKKYIHRKRVYKNGKVIYWSYEVYEEPTEEPLPENLLPGKPEIENLLPGNQEIENPEILVSNTVNSQHNKDSTDVESWSHSDLNTKKLRLNIKKLNGSKSKNGSLFDSKRSKPLAPIDLTGWSDHKLFRNKYELPVIELETKLSKSRKRILPAASEIKEILGYWNEVAVEMSSNGHKLPTHKIKDTKVIHMCKLVITGILHTTEFTKKDIIKAIDNYMWILENSPWFNTIYTFPRFYANKNLFENCITDNVKNNKSYVNVKDGPKKIGRRQLLDEMVTRHKKKNYGQTPDADLIRLWKHWISEGDIKTFNDISRVGGI